MRSAIIAALQSAFAYDQDIGGTSLSLLKPMLADGDSKVRLQALQYLAKVLSSDERLARDHVGMLIEMLEDDESGIRFAAAQSLDRDIAQNFADLTVPTYAGLLGTDGNTFDIRALHALENHGSKAAPAAGAVIERLSTNDPPERSSTDDWSMKRKAIRILANIGPAARNAEDILREIASKEQEVEGADKFTQDHWRSPNQGSGHGMWMLGISASDRKVDDTTLRNNILAIEARDALEAIVGDEDRRSEQTAASQ
jgi:HEAT repeat protein